MDGGAGGQTLFMCILLTATQSGDSQRMMHMNIIATVLRVTLESGRDPAHLGLHTEQYSDRSCRASWSQLSLASTPARILEVAFPGALMAKMMTWLSLTTRASPSFTPLSEWLETCVPVVGTLRELATVCLHSTEEKAQTSLLSGYVGAEDPVVFGLEGQNCQHISPCTAFYGSTHLPEERICRQLLAQG